MTPEPVAPMLAVAAPLLPADDGWAYERKHDGLRAIAHVHDGRCWVQTRHGDWLDLTGQDVLTGEMLRLPSGTVIDGELVGGVSRCRPALGRPWDLVAFDVLTSGGEDVRGRPYRVRRPMLEELAASAAIEVVDATADHATGAGWIMDAVWGREYDGVVAKDLESPYVAGVRSESWRKAEPPYPGRSTA